MFIVMFEDQYCMFTDSIDGVEMEVYELLESGKTNIRAFHLGSELTLEMDPDTFSAEVTEV